LIGGSLHWVAHWPTATSHDPTSHDLSLGMGFRGHHHTRSDDSFSLADWTPSVPLIAFSLAVAAAVYWMARANVRIVGDTAITGAGRRL
jgi:hypothetical protein